MENKYKWVSSKAEGSRKGWLIPLLSQQLLYFPYFEQEINIDTHPQVWDIARQAFSLLPRVLLHSPYTVGYGRGVSPWRTYPLGVSKSGGMCRSILESSTLRDNHRLMYLPLPPNVVSTQLAILGKAQATSCILFTPTHGIIPTLHRVKRTLHWPFRGSLR